MRRQVIKSGEGILNRKADIGFTLSEPRVYLKRPPGSNLRNQSMLEVHKGHLSEQTPYHTRTEVTEQQLKSKRGKTPVHNSTGAGSLPCKVSTENYTLISMVTIA